MTQSVPEVPAQRLGPTSSPDPGEQSVRRLADLVLGATSLADRLERTAPALGAPADLRERIADLRAFAEFTRRAIDRAVTDDAYARQLCGGTETPQESTAG